MFSSSSPGDRLSPRSHHQPTGHACVLLTHYGLRITNLAPHPLRRHPLLQRTDHALENKHAIGAPQDTFAGTLWMGH